MQVWKDLGSPVGNRPELPLSGRSQGACRSMPRNGSRSIDRSGRVFGACRSKGHAPTSSSLGDASEYVPLLGKLRLDPIDYRAHAGGAAQITVDDDPVFGGDLGDRRSEPLEQGMAVADIAGQYAAAGTGADRFQMHEHR